jgi:hypothetical protein
METFKLLRDENMADLPLVLSAEERQFLVEFLTAALKDTRIEEHRTRAPTYREHVLHKEDLITSLLNKLGQSPQ